MKHTELNLPLWIGHKLGKAIMEIRSFYECLISTMGFPILVRIHLYFESIPSITSFKPEWHMSEILIFHPHFITVWAVSGAWNIYACLRTSQLSRNIIWAGITACWMLYWVWKGLPVWNDKSPQALPLQYIEGILPKGPYLPCVSMAGRALLAGYHRYVITYV